MSSLKDFMRNFRIEHDARIAANYISKDELNFSNSDIEDVFANGGGSSVTPSDGGSTVQKIEPTLSVGEFEYWAEDDWRAPISYNGDGQLFSQFKDYTNDSVHNSIYYDNYYGNSFWLVVHGVHTGTYLLHATEGENYAAKTIEVEWAGED